jgi:serine/threonine protein kinase
MMPKHEETLGNGTYSTVVVDENGYAVKRIGYVYMESAIREIAILSVFSHPNIVKLLNVGWTVAGAELVMPRYDANLAAETPPDGIKNHERVYKLSYDILSAVAYLHAGGIIHCDIKPQNILVQDDSAVLCDFGISVVTGDRYARGNIQTCTYRAPEIDTDRRKLMYKDKVDMWSVGCVLYEMISGIPFMEYREGIDDSSTYVSTAFDIPLMDTRKERLRILRDVNTKYIKETLAAKLALIPDYGRYFDDGFISLIAMCLHPNANKRLDARSALAQLDAICRKYNITVSDVPLPGRNLAVYSQTDYDDLSVAVNIPEDLFKICSKTVFICAQGIYDRIPEPDQDVADLVKCCCIYIAACVFSANVSAINKIISVKWSAEKTNICAYIMQQINGYVI